MRAKAVKIGNIQESAKGNKYLRFTLVDEKRKRNEHSGVWETEEANFYSATAFGKTAENLYNLAQSLERKSFDVVVEGKITEGDLKPNGNGERFWPKIAVNEIGLDMSRPYFNSEGHALALDAQSGKSEGDKNVSQAKPKETSEQPVAQQNFKSPFDDDDTSSSSVFDDSFTELSDGDDDEVTDSELFG